MVNRGRGDKLKYIKTVSDIGKYLEYIPTEAIMDVNQRLGDAKLRGNLTETYLNQNLRYLDNIVKSAMKER